jgi:hypothetical protein
MTINEYYKKINLKEDRFESQSSDEKEATLSNHIPSSLFPKPSIKKSCISPINEAFNTKSVKKSSISVEETKEYMNSRDSIEHSNKFQKIEKESRILRQKKITDHQDKLSVYVKMREKFCNTKKPEKIDLGYKGRPVQKLYQFSSDFQTCTGITDNGTLKDLENKFKDYIRKNSNSKLNAFEFANKKQLVECFKCTEIKYKDLPSFIQANSTQLS